MTKYTSNDIQIAAGLDGVRINPAMYMGSVDDQGLFLSLRELLDNALDEYYAGRNNELMVIVDGSNYWVQDSGEGIPQGYKTIEMIVNSKPVSSKVPTMQAIFSDLHTSGKYQQKDYATVGTHGVGAKGTNATSDVFKVWTFYRGKCYHIAFAKGKLTAPVKVCSPPKSPFGSFKNGTLIHFVPDFSIYTVKKFDPIMLHDWARTSSALNPGFRIRVKCGSTTKTYLSEEGPKSLIDEEMQQVKAEYIGEPVLFDFASKDLDVSLAFTSYGKPGIQGYTNGLKNSLNGRHVDAVNDAIYKTLLSLAGARQKFGRADVLEGIIGLVNIKLHKAQFAGQNKARLSDVRATRIVKDAIEKELLTFFTKNKALLRDWLHKATSMGKLRERFKMSATVVRKLKEAKRAGPPAKFAAADSRTKIADRELYLVEGDSASGTLKAARFPYQAILPLRGKIKNAIRSPDAALNSDEVINIFASIGINPKDENPCAKLLTSKIIILTDPDPDGWHITSLILTLLATYTPALFDMGIIYIVDTYEYYSIHKGVIYTGETVNAVKTKLKAARATNAKIDHIKGWGQISSSLLRVLAMNPETRKLRRVNSGGLERLHEMMGADPSYRKEMLGIALENSNDD